MKKIILRLDDVGASSKEFELYSKRLIGNILFLKKTPAFAAWGPYKELSGKDWLNIIDLLQNFNAKMTVGITACWVEAEGKLIPFFDKFPRQALIIKKAVKNDLIEVANHGLTHCVVGKHRPKLFRSNRNFHREFWNYLPKEVHYEHIENSQKILENYFGKVTTFIPPGYVWSSITEKAALKYGIKYFCSNQSNAKKRFKDLIYIPDSKTFAVHDRDIVLNGIIWLKKKLISLNKEGYRITTVKNFVKNSKYQLAR